MLLRAREARHRGGPIKFNHRETPVVSDFRKVVAMGEAGSAGVVMSSAVFFCQFGESCNLVAGTVNCLPNIHSLFLPPLWDDVTAWDDHVPSPRSCRLGRVTSFGCK